jgi:hypothetical protein
MAIRRPFGLRLAMPSLMPGFAFPALTAPSPGYQYQPLSSSAGVKDAFPGCCLVARNPGKPAPADK